MKITATADMTVSEKRKFFISILMLFMFSGIIVGTLFVIKDEESRFIVSGLINQHLIKNTVERSLIKVFTDSFLPLLFSLLIQVLCGLFAMGQPLSLLTLFHRGIAGGISAALIYINYGLKGFFIILIMLLPVLLFSMFILVLGARESIKSSNKILCFAFGKENAQKVEIKLYIIKFIVLTVFALLCSVMDSALTYIFTGLLLKP